MSKKKYSIISSFTYKGVDDKAKQEDWVRYGPGEEVPKLDTDALNRLMAQEKIAEVSAETGEVILTKKVTRLDDAAINRFMIKGVQSILAAISSEELAVETLGKMLVIAEREKMDTRIKNAIEEKLNIKLAE